MADWTVAVEGDADDAIARAILRHLGQGLARAPLIAGGTSKLDPRLSGYAAAAQRTPWRILRDMDRAAECAPGLVAKLLPGVSCRALRVAVREAEAWLLADRERAARWLRVSVARLPRDVETLTNPKQRLIDLARGSRSREIIADIVPDDGSSASQGRGYVDQVRAYCDGLWRPGVAANHCDSLRRCLDFVRARALA